MMDFYFPVILGQETSYLQWFFEAVGIGILLIPLLLLISIGMVIWSVKSGNKRSLDEPGGSIRQGGTRAVLATICGLVAVGLLLFFSGLSKLLMVMVVEFPPGKEMRDELSGMATGYGISQVAAVLLGIHALLFVSGASRLARTGRVSTVEKIIMGVGGLLIAIGGLLITVGSSHLISVFNVIAISDVAPNPTDLKEVMFDTHNILIWGLSCLVCGVLLVLVAMFQVARRKLPAEPRTGRLAGQGLMALGSFLVLFGGLSASLLIMNASMAAGSTMEIPLGTGDSIPRPTDLATGISTFYFGWLLAGNFLVIWGLGQVLAVAPIGNPAALSEESGSAVQYQGLDLHAETEPAGDVDPA
jgi:cytochrome b561